MDFACPEMEITRAKREVLIDAVTKELSGGLQDQMKDFYLESVDLNQYGRHVIVFSHLGIPEDGDAGLDALTAVARSFHFD